MSATTTSLSRSDRIGMYFTIVLGALGAAATVWVMITRLAEVLPGRDVPVLVPFIGETATLPIGPDGAQVPVDVYQAIVTVADPAAATHFALVAQPIVVGLAILPGILLLCLFCFNLARGRAFAKSTVRILFLGAGVLLGGWVLGSLFQTMGVNGALSAVSDYSYDGVLFQTDFTAAFGVLVLAAIGAAFQIGHRLQRETEGLFLLAGLARRVSQGVSFVPAVSRTAWALAIVLAAGSWLAQIGENVAVHSGVIYPDSGEWTTMDPALLPLRWDLGPTPLLPDLPYLGLALVVAVLAWIIQSGKRLQRETEGLV